ncbi:MAG: nicotinate (nicotinamide) nucleotide adenylyltransferase [Candidatus Levybacteria bacterium]|nr:nicotinate (nicotinamide) nucleotide adenylyltransferase [Candidatus Levybacteria bacterium]
MNIAVLGASFDPSHNGHLTIAKNVLKLRKIRKVILMPVNIHPFAKKLIQAKHRLAMAKLLEEKNIEVSDLEIKRGKISYTIDTLNELKKLYSKDHFVWIIGEDQIKNFTKWKSWQEIIGKFGLIIISRKGFSHSGDERSEDSRITSFWRFWTSQNDEKHTTFINKKSFKPIDVSSSQIKKMVKEGKSISNLVPKKVEKYIIRNKLYR